MKRLIYLKRPGLLFRTIVFKIQALLLKKIIRSSNAWQLFNHIGVEGFGVNLVRLYFPIYYDKKIARDSFSQEAKDQISSLFQTGPDQSQYTTLITETIPGLLELPKDEISNTKPYLDNYYFGVYDAAVLSAIMQSFRPAKILEIGSGISTRYMKLFKDQLSLDTQIVCVDPFPRAEIAGVADVIIQQPLENAIENGDFNLQSGDIVFLDGSHYVFQGNDTLTFFFKFLPALPAGVVIHIHDIYLPFDYPVEVAPQLWTEQYILAAMLLSGFKGYEVLYPAYYMCQTDEKLMKVLEEANTALTPRSFKLKTNHNQGFSFWMRKV